MERLVGNRQKRNRLVFFCISLLTICVFSLPSAFAKPKKKRPPAPPPITAETVAGYLQTGKPVEALATAKRLLIANPYTRTEARILELYKKEKSNPLDSFTEAEWIKRAESLYQKGLPREAIKIYRKLDGTGTRFKWEIAEATFKARDYYQAADLFDDLLRRAGGNRAAILSMLATCHGRTDQFTRAIRYHQDIVNRYPGSFLSQSSEKKIAFLHFDSGDYKSAREAYLKLLPRFPAQQEENQKKLFWSSYLLKDYADATARLNWLASREKNQKKRDQWTYWRARILEKTGKKAEAHALYSSLITNAGRNYYSFLAIHEINKKIPAYNKPFNDEGGYYGPIVKRFCREFGLDPKVAWSIMRQESNFRPHVVSRAQAMGLMQIIPQTALEIAEDLKKTDFYPEDLRNPETNVEFGVWYLKKLLNQHQKLEYAIASYNAGPDAVTRWRKWGDALEMDEFVELIPYAETNNYVKKVMTNYWSH